MTDSRRETAWWFLAIVVGAALVFAIVRGLASLRAGPGQSYETPPEAAAPR